MKTSILLSCIAFMLLVLLSCNSNSSTTEVSTTTDSSSTSTNPAPATQAPRTVESFMVEGHEVLKQTKADLNGDGFEDVIMVLKNKKEEEIANETGGEVPRPLLILTGNESGSFNLALRNDNVVLCSSCGGAMGDPFEGFEAQKGGFSLGFYGGASARWSRSLEFEYDGSQAMWVLKTDESEYFTVENPDKGKVKNNKKAATPLKDFDVYAAQ